MDDRRFDDITRLAAGASRRQAIKALGGSAAGGLLAFFGVRRGVAQESQPDCCPADKPRLCDDRCVDLSSDADNCGSCGAACRGNEICVDGQCARPARSPQSRCPKGTTECNGVCVDLNTDEYNCGSCGTVCANGATCQDGVCVGEGVCEPGQTRQCGSDVGACQPGTETCQGDGTWGPCEGGVGPQPEVCDGIDNDCDGQADEDWDFETDPLNCGGCGNECASGKTCEAGSCTGTGPVCGDGNCDEDAGETCDNCSIDCCPENQCDPGYEWDGTTCVDIDECETGTAGCSPNATCTNTDGGFTCACNEGYVGDGMTCTPDGSGGGGECTSNADCGTCGVCDGGICEPAAAGTVCRASAGVCDVAETCDGVSMDCPADAFAVAGTVCRPAISGCDVTEYCTGTSASCPSDAFAADGTLCEGGTCQNGTCVQTGCPSGTTNCNGVCVDLNTDENNCGGCDNVCGGAGQCIAATCEPVCGDFYCDTDAGETCESCPTDCGPCAGDST